MRRKKHAYFGSPWGLASLQSIAQGGGHWTPVLVGLLLLINGRVSADGERKNFLSHGPGAAEAAMGEAVTALADDVTAIYYNPAGLSYQAAALHAEHTPVFDGGRYNFLGLNYPSHAGSFGFGIIQYAVDGIEGRQNIGDAPVDLSASQTAWYVPYSYGWKSVSLGGALKVVQMNLGGASAAGFGADGGALYRHDLNDWAFLKRPSFNAGLSVKNLLEPSYTLVQDQETLPTDYKTGVALSGHTFGHFSKGDSQVVYDEVTLAADIAKTPGQQALVGYGLRYAVWGLWPLRIGYDGHYTLGVGYGNPSKPIQFDYSFAMTGLGAEHRFSFEYRFKPLLAREPVSLQLNQYRRYRRDMERYRDRYLSHGRSCMEEKRYGDALRAFEKAAILDSENQEAQTLVSRAREARDMALVHKTLEEAKASLAKGDYKIASQKALEALEVPDNSDVQAYLASLQKTLLGTSHEAFVYFDSLRNQEIAHMQSVFHQELQAKYVLAARHMLLRAQTLAPDHPIVQAMQTELTLTEPKILEGYMASANLHLVAGNDVDAYFDYWKAHAMAPGAPEVQKDWGEFRADYLLRKKYSLEDTLYQDQLYCAAALHFVRGEYADSWKRITELLAVNAIHDAGNALKAQLILSKPGQDDLAEVDNP